MKGQVTLWFVFVSHTYQIVYTTGLEVPVLCVFKALHLRNNG